MTELDKALPWFSERFKLREEDIFVKAGLGVNVQIEGEGEGENVSMEGPLADQLAAVSRQPVTSGVSCLLWWLMRAADKDSWRARCSDSCCSSLRFCHPSIVLLDACVLHSREEK